MGAIIWNMMRNEFTCVAVWCLDSAKGEVEQARQSLLWAEENAEGRGVDKADDMNVDAGINRVNSAYVRLERAELDLKNHVCAEHPICAKLRASKNGS